MTPKETIDLAYWERNMLALHYADGWFYDDIEEVDGTLQPRYKGWRRVLTLQDGEITFHIPDDFNVGDLPQVPNNWDGHTTTDKWMRIAITRGCMTLNSKDDER